MLKLSLKPGEYITLGDNIKIIFSGGSANNIHLLVDAPREINVARNSAGKDKKPSPYYKEKGISKTAQREIAEILMREKRNQLHVSGEETVTQKTVISKAILGTYRKFLLCYVSLFWHSGTYRIIPLHYVPYVCGNGTYSVFSGIYVPVNKRKGT